MRKPILSIASTLLLLSACGSSRDSATADESLAEGAGDISQAPADQGEALPLPPAGSQPGAVAPVPVPDPNNSSDPPGESLNEADDGGSESSPPSLVIPAQYRGRWGMVPADCEPGRSDAKGLLTIGDTTLRFYESVGALQEQRPAIATSFAGVYSFTGEGQSWERVVVLTRDGNRLTRAEGDRRYGYTRC